MALSLRAGDGSIVDEDRRSKNERSSEGVARANLAAEGSKRVFEGLIGWKKVL